MMNGPVTQKPKAILFDMGGVLCPAAAKWDEDDYPLSFPDGLPLDATHDWFMGMSREVIDTYLAMPVPRPVLDPAPIVTKWLRLRGEADEEDAMARWLDMLCHWEARPVYDFVPEALHALHGAGYALGVVSNTVMPGTHIRRRFAEAGILDLFEVLVFSAEVGVNKPDPRVFRLALAQMNAVAGRAWYAGDKPQRDVCGAHRAGMTAVLVDSSHAHRVNDAPDHMPDVRVQTVADLPELLRAQAL